MGSIHAYGPLQPRAERPGSALLLACRLSSSASQSDVEGGGPLLIIRHSRLVGLVSYPQGTPAADALLDEDQGSARIQKVFEVY